MLPQVAFLVISIQNPILTTKTPISGQGVEERLGGVCKASRHQALNTDIFQCIACREFPEVEGIEGGNSAADVLAKR